MKELPDDERPREKLLMHGAQSLSDSQVLSILLRNGCQNKNVHELAIEILQKYPISAIKECSYYDFISIKGIGKETLVKFQCAEDIWKDIKYYITDLKQEYFYCYYFNQKQELLERKLLFMGTINRSIVHPREIFKEAYRLSASSIVCIHNHPSNYVMPSKEDVLLTDHLVKTGYVQGIPVQDHIIVGEDSYYSFYEHHNILNL